MTNFKSVDEILDFAIKGEQGAQKFYAELAAQSKKAGMKKMFEGFVLEEKKHEDKLVAIKAGKCELAPEAKVTDLKIGDYVTDVEPKPDMKLQDALIVAMKKEKAAFRLYSDLAAQVAGDLQQTFLGLAQEEAKHKLFFEIEYDDYVMQEN